MIDNEVVYEFEGFRLDTKKQRLFRNDEIVSLPPKAIELLTLMVSKPGHLLEKDDLMEILWSDTIVEEANLTQTVYLLRKALGKTERGEIPIITIPKRGYKFTSPVRKFSSSDELPLAVEKAVKEQVFISRETTERTFAASFESIELVDSDLLASKIRVTPTPKTKSTFFERRYLLVSTLAIVLLGSIAAFFLWRGNPQENTQKEKTVKSLVVLPFKFIGNDERKEYLSTGLADTLVTRLRNTRKISVRSVYGLPANSNAKDNPLEVGKRLGADVVLTGSIQQFNERVRFNAQLLSVSEGQIIWSDQLDEDSSDLFALQDVISRRLTSGLMLQLSDDEQKLLTQKTTENPDGLRLYWQGRFYWNRRTPEWIKKGIECFEEAIRLDPNFAQAYAGLADSYALTVSGFPPKERLPKAKAAAQRALELNENLGEAHASLAIVTYKLDWNWSEAESHFKRAIELNDSYATAHHWYGEFLVLLGKSEEGLKELSRAEQLDPFSLAIKTDIAEALYRARRPDEALAQTRKLLDLDPNFIQVYRIIRHIQKLKGEPESEITKTDIQIQRLAGMSPVRLSQLESAINNQDWKRYWQVRLQALPETKERLYFVEKSEILLRLGEKEQAVRHLKSQLQGLELTPLLLHGEPIFDPIRPTPEFQSLLRLGGLATTG